MGSTQELQHWGIKGQHWGIRRYQNPDGSLTEAGKKRYYYQNPDGSLTEAGKKDYMKAARKGKLDASKLSDNDLNMINLRFAREKTFNQNVSDYEKSTLKYRLKEAAIARIKGSGGGGKGKGGGSGIAKILAIPIKKAFTDAFAEQKGGGKDSGKDDGYDEDNKWWRDVSNRGHRFTEKYFDPEKRPGIERTKKDIERGKKHMNFVVNETSGGRMGTFDATKGGNSYVEGRVRAAQQKKAEEKARRAAQRDAENRRQKNESENRRKEMDTEERLKKLGLAYASHSAIVIRRNSSDELYHWGIKGQKWGVRRYQNSDGTLTPEGKERYGVNQNELDKTMKKGVRDQRLTEAHVIPKGTKIYRVTSSRDDYDSGTTYVSYMDMDRQHYKAGWIRDAGKTGKAFEHTYELQQDLKVPSRKEVEDVVSSVMKNNQKLVNETCKNWLDVTLPEGTWARTEIMWNSDAHTEKQAQKVWKDYTNELIKNYKNMSPSSAAFFTMQSFGLNKKVRKMVIDELSKRGYNAMTDEASVGGRNEFAREGGDPLIIFDRSNMFKETSNKEISRSEERKSLRKYSRYEEKIRRRGTASW